MNVPFLDLKAQYQGIKNEVNSAIQNVLDNTAFILGQDVKDFEEKFAKFCGVTYCIGISSGSAALVLALKAVGLKPGDEVLVPANTYIATSSAVTLAGGKVVFVDVDPKTRNMDVYLARKAITQKTKVILPVHLYGQPADMKAIADLAKEKNLRVIEDCAQSHAAEVYGKRVPSIDIGCFSFYPGKNLGAYGDGGAVVTNDREIQQKICMYRDQGRAADKQVHYLEWTNERLDNLQAAILNVKLNHLEKWTEQRRKNAVFYNKVLADVPVVTPFEADFAKHVYHLYVVELTGKSSSRAEIMQKLKDAGIATGMHYQYPLHLQPAYSYLGYKLGAFPVAEKLTSEIISLPMYPELTEEQMVYVAERMDWLLK